MQRTAPAWLKRALMALHSGRDNFQLLVITRHLRLLLCCNCMNTCYHHTCATPHTTKQALFSPILHLPLLPDTAVPDIA
jgi:hypothetical protein